MNLIDITLLAVALAMDCLTVSVVSGLTAQESKTHSIWLYRMASLFGFFQAFMPLLGWLGISHFQSYIEAYGHWTAFVLLAFIGGKMVWESFDDEEEHNFNPRRLRTQLLLAIATSIDALAVGISFACTGYTKLSDLSLPLIIIGTVSFLFSIMGYCLGRRFGKTITKRMKPELMGGLILIAIGVKILMT